MSRAGHREGEGATIPAGHKIDYCFVSPRLARRVKRAWIDTRATGSDHYPFWVEIDL